MNYPHRNFDIYTALDEAIDQLEENMKVFANRLAEKEKHKPHLYYQSQKSQLSKAIYALKEARNQLGSLDWV